MLLFLLYYLFHLFILFYIVFLLEKYVNYKSKLFSLLKEMKGQMAIVFFKTPLGKYKCYIRTFFMILASRITSQGGPGRRAKKTAKEKEGSSVEIVSS